MKFMAFDINEARAIIEEAKQRGLIRDAGFAPIASKAKEPSEVIENEVLPEWLKEGIRQGPLVRSDSEQDRG